MTIEELAQKLEELQAKYENLEYKYLKLREWSDDNDYWLREMIDALTESVDDLSDNHCQCEVYRQHHEKRKLAKEKAREAGEEYREWRCTHRNDE